MTKHVLILMTSAFILACGAIAASAQQNSSTPMMLDPADEDGPGMMSHDMRRHGMMRLCMRHCMMENLKQPENVC